jgi:NADH-quinone oxidoreductase subunit J
MFGLLPPTVGALVDYADEMLFGVLFLLAVGAAVSLVTQRNPLYCAISLVFVFLSLAGLYVLLAAPFIAAVQIIVYAGAIMVLVVFVIMLLNVEDEERRPLRLRYLVPTAISLAAVLFAEVAFILYFVHDAGSERANAAAPANTGLTANIGAGLFTIYLLPFEITSLLILMAIVGAMTLARRASALRPTDAVVPGAQVLTRQTLGGAAIADATPLVARTTAEAESALGLADAPHRRERDER